MTTITCHLCANSAELAERQTLSALCAGCGVLLFRPIDGPQVLVAHGTERILSHIGLVLVGAGLRPVAARDATESRRVLQEVGPGAAVFDVALDGVAFFTLIDEIRSTPALQATKVVIVASVYDRMAYKRKPTSLYGADDYVEEHHVTDKLPVKVGALLERSISASPTQELFDRVNAQIQTAELQGHLEPAQRVDVLATRIVADIALYMQAEVEQALSAPGDGAAAVSEPAPELAAALDEGRSVLATLCGAAVPSGDPISAAFEQLKNSMRQSS